MMMTLDHASIIPGAFGGCPPRMRLSTPPLECRDRDSGDTTMTMATTTANNNGGSCGGGVPKVSSMDFDLLFDTATGTTDVDHQNMETVREEEQEEEEEQQRRRRQQQQLHDDNRRRAATAAAAHAHAEKKEEDAHATLDPTSVYVRIVGNLSRPRDVLEHNVAKRFAAACRRVGAGELGDAAHIEALQRAFNGYKMDPVRGHEVVEKTAEDYYDHASTSSSSSDCPAFVATTPGAAGHAALLNLRHSFLWLKPSDVDDVAAAAAALRHDDAHPHDVQQYRRQQQQQHQQHQQQQQRQQHACHSRQLGHAEILVLEPDIKAHFVISRPTAGYQRLIDALPDHFVGTHKRLVELVDFLCERMLVSFRESGMSVPPWRKNKSILSKWFLPTAKSGSQPPTPTGSPPPSKLPGGPEVGYGRSVVVHAQQQQQAAAGVGGGRSFFGTTTEGVVSSHQFNGGHGAASPHHHHHHHHQQSSPGGHSFPRSSIDYAAPVVGEAASPNKVKLGFNAGSDASSTAAPPSAARMAVRAA